METTYGYGRAVERNFDEALEQVIAALQHQSGNERGQNCCQCEHS